MGFVSELKRRNVFRVGIAYVLAAWLLVQIGEALFPAFNVPDSIFRGMVIVLFLGFPVALLVSWIYDITPEGIRRDSETDPSDLSSRQTGRKLDFAVIGLLAVAVAYFAVDKFVLQTPEQEPVAEQAIPEQPLTGERPSVAVLPFQNRSALEEDAYFVDGIHDDILTQLSKIGALTVIARTSVEQFRDTQLPVREIARLLGVSAIIEGGVQRAGDRVRINVQFIDTTNEGHFWAETYDREINIENIFAIQTEVANAIASAMKATLTVEEAAKISTVPTQNLEAWEAYQLGRHKLGQPTAEDNAEAQQLFSHAIDLDPGFALAHIGLARARLSQQDLADVSRETALAGATAATEKALSLDPDLPEGLAMFAQLLIERHEYAAAEPFLIRALELNPNSAPALQGYAQLLPSLGRNEEAVAPGKRLVQLDPLDASNHQNLGVSLFAVGRFSDALVRMDRALEIDQLDWFSYHVMGHIIEALGRLDLAVPWYEKALDLGGDVWFNKVSLGSAHLALGNYAEGERLTSEALRASGRNQLQPLMLTAILRYYLGDEESALALLVEAQGLDSSGPVATVILADIDLIKGDVRKARERYEKVMPELFVDEPVLADVDCSCTSVPLAGVLWRNGEFDRAEHLLQLSETWNSKLPRLGPYGYGTNDVEIHALRGNSVQALNALRDAKQAGWRSPFWRYQRDINPALDSIRNEAEFKAIFADIEQDMNRQRAALAARSDSTLDLDSWQIAIQEASIAER